MAPSSAYNFFNILNDRSYATCKLCRQEIHCRKPDSTLQTSSMIRHLHRKHSEELCNFPRSSVLSVEPQTCFADRERDLNAFFNKQSHGREHASSSVEPPPDSVFTESGYPRSEDGMSSCSRETSLGRVAPVFGKPGVNHSDFSDMEDDILVYIELLMRDIKDLKTRLSHLETSPSKLPDTEILEQEDDITYKPNIITVKGFTFEDYPH